MDTITDVADRADALINGAGSGIVADQYDLERQIRLQRGTLRPTGEPPHFTIMPLKESPA